MSDGAGAIFGATFFLLYLGLIAIVLASWWKIFTKADKPGWAGIVPIYNAIVLMDIIGRPGWWFILLMVPPPSPSYLASSSASTLRKASGKDPVMALPWCSCRSSCSPSWRLVMQNTKALRPQMRARRALPHNALNIVN
ncbi:DUF5684 domain-containing protein [Longibacter salinarum]|uniref:DUF5684 domain-containing protein n=1 Tax=Longibacter salinarum TaxID=1850348 RepID=UPI001C54D517|nr:DUF5684 domain-containing protein [Longibacter salinarum]